MCRGGSDSCGKSLKVTRGLHSHICRRSSSARKRHIVWGSCMSHRCVTTSSVNLDITGCRARLKHSPVYCKCLCLLSGAWAARIVSAALHYAKLARKTHPYCITACIWLNQLHANIHKTCRWYCASYARAISMPLLAPHESMRKVDFSFMYKAVCLLYDLFSIETDTII